MISLLIIFSIFISSIAYAAGYAAVGAAAHTDCNYHDYVEPINRPPIGITQEQIDDVVMNKEFMVKQTLKSLSK